MPELITKVVGLSFSNAEIEIKLGKSIKNALWDLDLSDEICDMLFDACKAGEFTNFGFDEFCEIDEILFLEDSVLVQF